ncbi:MAG: hypothetical protein GWP06_03855 [Actinobacteria bacterium]|nr:hypothetical protein [Actinomycetota bacterium]
MSAKRNHSRRDFLKASFVLYAASGAAFALHGCGRENSVRFGIVTDSHYADRQPAGTRFYRDSLLKIRKAVDLMNEKKPDFLIELGDFKDQDAKAKEKNTLGYLRDIENELQKFTGLTYHVLGNHDADSLSKTQFLQNVTNANIPADQSYYSFDLKGFHFVVLDANFTSDGTPYDHGNFDWTDANIPPLELKWLKENLRAGSGPVIVFVHQLLDGQGHHYIKNAAQVRQVLQQSGRVLAVFQGHKHKGQYNRINGIHYITLQAMVEGEGLDNNCYYVVGVNEKFDIMIQGYHRGKSYRLLT